MGPSAAWQTVREAWWMVALGAVLGLAVALLLPPALAPRGAGADLLLAVTVPTAVGPDGRPGAMPADEARVDAYADLLRGSRVASDTSVLLGGTPPPAVIAESIEVEGPLEPGSVIPLDRPAALLVVHVTRPTEPEATLVASALGTAASRLVAQTESVGRPVNRPAGSLEVVSGPDPVPPAALGSDTPALLGTAGLVGGAVLGAVVALLLAARRDVVVHPEPLARRTGVPVLGALPPRPATVRGVPAVLVAVGESRRDGPARRRADAVRALAEAVRGAPGAERCLAVVGVGEPEEGWSAAAEAAAALGVAGRRVLLIEGGLRAPVLASRLRLEPVPGLAELIEGDTTAERAVRRWEAVGIEVLPLGSPARRPERLLADERTAGVLAALAVDRDHVLLDVAGHPGSPALADAGRCADAALVVVRRGTRIADVDTCVNALRLAGVPIRGTVLTDTLETVTSHPPAVI